MKAYLGLLTVACMLTSGTLHVDRRAGDSHGGPGRRLAVRNGSAQDSLGAAVYHRQCAPCHGDEGKGDGPASVAFNPRPADLTNADRMSGLTDEDLVAVIGKGRSSMPAFGALLSPEELRAVAGYVRSLSLETGREKSITERPNVTHSGSSGLAPPGVRTGGVS